MVRQPAFFIDSAILIHHIRQPRKPTFYDKATEVYGTAVVSEIVIFELEVGARRAGREFEFQAHFAHLQTYPITQQILIEAAQIQADLLGKNQVIGLADTFIAATAIFHGLPLFTLNEKHFQRIPTLKLLPIP